MRIIRNTSSWGKKGRGLALSSRCWEAVELPPIGGEATLEEEVPDSGGKTRIQQLDPLEQPEDLTNE